ncbi:MFS transporter [Streptomyces spectabilis]|uniref:MFS transporter n=1 Tax=Streptomyces spectabilis TaxID=68270 RepID=A0A516RH89_STRST|nr:MFS transporter [Streptomyces spectabilis]QDQ15004.1 MFS transporter [Streptomyces spectabilis]
MKRSLADALLPAPGAPRLLAASWLIKTLGSGLYLPTSVLFFTRVAGLSTGRVAFGLTLAGLVSLAGAVPIGGLADRYGPRRTYAVLLVVQFAVMAALALVRSYAPFLALIIVFTLAEQGSSAARGALVAAVGEGAERVGLRAYLRVVTNVGVAMGAGLAAIAIGLGTDTAYTVLLLGTALTFPAAALPLRRLAADSVMTGTGAPVPPARWQVFRDVRYLWVTVICGVLSLQAQVLSFVVPLWVVGHTSAPKLTVSVVVVVNAALVILLQIRASRGAEDDTRAARLCRRAGLCLLAACVVIVFTRTTPAWLSVALLIAFAVLLTAGELWTSAGSFGLSFTLAPDGAHGQYQGFFALGKGMATAVAPWLLSVLCLSDDPARGWLALGALFAAAGLLMPVAVRRAPARVAV